MIVSGLERVAPLLEDESFEFKMVFNDQGAILFPVSSQHRDMKSAGISYEDDSKGNALAAMVKPGKLEIRHHQAFSDARVGLLVSRILRCPELSFAKNFAVTYQNRPISVE